MILIIQDVVKQRCLQHVQHIVSKDKDLCCAVRGNWGKKKFYDITLPAPRNPMYYVLESSCHSMLQAAYDFLTGKDGDRDFVLGSSI